MSVVVTLPDQEEPWKVSGRAFELLAAEVQRLTADSDFMLRAAANNGLHLGMETVPERVRIATLLAQAARTLRAQLLSSHEPTDWDQSLAAYLPVLEMWMEGLADSPG